MPPSFAILLAFLALAALAAYNVVRLRRARATLDQALRGLGHSLVSARLCWAPRGPFSTAIARHQPVYRVTALDPSGRPRTGWIRCAPFSDRTWIAWDDTR